MNKEEAIKLNGGLESGRSPETSGGRVDGSGVKDLLRLLREMVYLSFGFGFLALIVQGSLAHVIAIGHVNMESSYGLLNVLGSLNTALGAFVGFAFGAMMWSFVLRFHEPNKVINNEGDDKP